MCHQIIKLKTQRIMKNQTIDKTIGGIQFTNDELSKLNYYQKERYFELLGIDKKVDVNKTFLKISKANCSGKFEKSIGFEQLYIWYGVDTDRVYNLYTKKDYERYCTFLKLKSKLSKLIN